MKKLLLVPFCCLALLSWAAEYFVDAKNGNDAWDGTSSNFVSGVTGPKRTLQAAANLIKNHNGNIITVLPGVYDEGGATYGADYSTTNRLCLAYKSVVVRSTGGKEVTHIVGASDSAYEDGCGPAAMRCVMGPGSDKGTVLIGFTLRDGHNGLNESKNEDRGGGAINVSLYDCTISNCVAKSRGGAGNGCTFVRCRIIGNTAGNSSCGMACNNSSLANCLVARNYGGATLSYTTKMVNTTVVANYGGDPLLSITSGETTLWNCFLAGNYNGQNGFGSAGNAQTTSKGITYYSYCTNTVCERRAFFADVNDESVTNAPLGQCVSSAFGDGRLLANSVAVGRGDAAYLDMVPIPEGYVHMDLDGNVLPTSGPINCGCFQQTVASTGARVDFGSSYEWDAGETLPVNKYTTHTFTDAAETLKIKPSLNGTLYGLYADSENNGDSANYRIPMMDGYVRIVANPDPDFVIALKVRAAAAKYYVDCNIGSDDYDGMSPTVESPSVGPKKTLAGVCAVANANYNLVYVAPGVYDEKTCSGTVPTRLSIGRTVGFISSGGIGAATIKGGDQVRCAYLGAANAFLQGFVLADGSSTADTADGHRGSAFYASSVTAKVLDCTITNCTASYVIAYRGTLLRSKVVDCMVNDGPLTYLTMCASSVFAGNRFGVDSSPNTIFYDRSQAFCCTVDAGDQRVYETRVTSAVGNLVVGRPLVGTDPASNYFDNVENVDPAFVSRARRDFRLGVLSPALGAVDPQNLARCQATFYLSTDVDGRPLRAVNGRLTAGAVNNEPLPCVVVGEPRVGALTVENGIVGTNAIAQESAPIVLTKTLNRPFVGFAKDGEIVTSGTSYTVPAPSGTDVSTVMPVYSNVWYVAKDGDDGNGGGTPGTAKQTIPAAANNVEEGDVILVGPGTYGAEGGTMLQTTRLSSGTPTRPSRVWVKPGVALKSTAGAENTLIVGARATEGADEYGNGADAIRCVALSANASIEGFTLTGGASTALATKESYTDDDATGGVLGESHETSIVRDCIISNNVSCSCGAGFNCRFIGTRIFDNVSKFRASAGRQSDYIGCVIDRNKGNNLCEHYWVFDSNTIGGNNFQSNGYNRPTTLQYPRNGAVIVNSVVLQPSGVIGATDKEGTYPYSAVNTVYMKGSGPSPSNEDLVDCIFTNAAACALDADLRPIVGESILIDRARPDASCDEANAMATDATGAQRVMNGRRDIGGAEGDWRPRYGKDIGGRAQVVEASPDVVEANGKVTIPGGSRIVFDLTNRRTEAGEYLLSVAVGGGTLSVSVDGEPVEFADAMSIVLPLESDTHRVDVTLAGEKADTAVIQSLRNQSGMLLFVR